MAVLCFSAKVFCRFRWQGRRFNKNSVLAFRSPRTWYYQVRFFVQFAKKRKKICTYQKKVVILQSISWELQKLHIIKGYTHRLVFGMKRVFVHLYNPLSSMDYLMSSNKE